MPRPRAGDWADDEFAGLRELGIDTIVSLLQISEAKEVGLGDEEGLCRQNRIECLSFPIADRAVPDDIAGYCELVAGIANRLNQGRSVAVHCRAGIGRSGLTVAAVLVALGDLADSVFETVSSARGLTVPDTPEQVEWFHNHVHRFRV